MIGWTSTPLAGGGRGAGADHASANMIPTNLIMMKGAQVGQGLESIHLQSRCISVPKQTIGGLPFTHTYLTHRWS